MSVYSSNQDGGNKSPSHIGNTVLIHNPNEPAKPYSGIIVQEKYTGTHPDFNKYLVLVNGEIKEYTGIRIQIIPTPHE